MCSMQFLLPNGWRPLAKRVWPESPICPLTHSVHAVPCSPTDFRIAVTRRQSTHPNSQTPTSRLIVFGSRQSIRPGLLQLGILGLSLFQDGNVGIGVLPEREEVLVSGSCFVRFALENIGASKAEAGERA